MSPEMPRIQTLRPNVTREEAIRHFSQGLVNGAAALIRGPVRSLAELYIPYRPYRVKISSAGREQTQTFALDAVHGTLDLYQLPALTAGEQFLALETRNAIPAGLDAKQAAERLVAKVRRMVFTRGFFRVRDLKIQATPLSGEIYVPYWVCFRGSNEQVHLAVMDAVRRRPEGAKVRRMVEEWLRSDAAEGLPSEPPGTQVLS
jgi:hypothetical protein